MQVNPLINSVLQDITPVNATSSTPAAAISTARIDSASEPTRGSLKESDSHAEPTACEACKAGGTCNACLSLPEAFDNNLGCAANSINRVDSTTSHMNAPFDPDEGFRERRLDNVNKLTSHVDSLAICMAAATKPISFNLRGIRITEAKAQLVLFSSGISIASLLIRLYAFSNDGATN